MAAVCCQSNVLNLYVLSLSGYSHIPAPLEVESPFRLSPNMSLATLETVADCDIVIGLLLLSYAVTPDAVCDSVPCISSDSNPGGYPS